MESGQGRGARRGVGRLVLLGAALATVGVVAVAVLTATGTRTQRLVGSVSGSLDEDRGPTGRTGSGKRYDREATGDDTCTRPRPCKTPAPAAGEPPLVELAKSYVDKLTRVTPAERPKSKALLVVHAHGLKKESEAASTSSEGRFEGYGVNPFVDTSEDGLSTFAIDVDTASYTVMRNYLTRGKRLPPKNAVRVEEYVNFFDYEYAPPQESSFAIHCEGAPSPYRKNHVLLRVGVKGREVEREDRQPVRLTFVIDISGSMGPVNRLPLVKRSLAMLVDELQEGDQVGIAVYGNRGRQWLEHTDIEDRSRIKQSIARLCTCGATNAEAGLVVGYQMAAKAFSEDCTNRVILCSDGVANVGRTGPEAILEQIKKHADKGVYLTTVGFGMGSYNDVMMEQLANKGNGTYAYVDRLGEAKRLFVEKLTGTLLTVAKDAKIQVAFDAKAVKRYRLLGYENRDVADRDFRNDDIDAGEVGAGHAATALYELELSDDVGERLGTVRVRFTASKGERVTEIQEHIVAACVRPSFEKGSSAYRLAAVAGQFAEVLRQSEYATSHRVEGLIPHIHRLARELRHDKHVQEFKTLVDRAAEFEAAATD